MDHPLCNSLWPQGPLLMLHINFIAVISANAQCQFSFLAFWQEESFVPFDWNTKRDGKKGRQKKKKKDSPLLGKRNKGNQWVELLNVSTLSLQGNLCWRCFIGQEVLLKLELSPFMGNFIWVKMLQMNPPYCIWGEKKNYRFFGNLLYIGKYNKLITERCHSTDVEFSFKLRHCKQKGQKIHR